MNTSTGKIMGPSGELIFRRMRLAFSILLASASIVNVGKTDEANNGIFLRPVEKADGGYLTWMQTGRLFRVFIQESSSGIYLYRPKEGDPFIVSGSRGAVSHMLRTELADDPDARRHILPYLDRILFSLLASGALIDKHFLRDYSNVMDESALKVKILAARGQKVRAGTDFSDTMKITTRRMNESYLRVGKEKWSLMFFVAKGDGSVERWTASGKLQEFDIDVLDQEIVSPSGTLVMLPPAPQ